VSQTQRPTGPVELFYSYAHEDETLRDELETQLSTLKRQGVITNWHDRMIDSGDDWAGRIDEHINTAQIILLLVSADFLASRYCYDVEMARALERDEAREARVIPVILRPCDWSHTPIGRLQALPKGGRPVTLWANQDEALLDVAKGIRKVVEQLTRGRVADERDKPPGGWTPPLPGLFRGRPWWWTAGAVSLTSALVFTQYHRLIGPPAGPKAPAPPAPSPEGETVGNELAPPPPDDPKLPPVPAHDELECIKLAAQVYDPSSGRASPSMVASVTVKNETGRPLNVLRYVHACKPRHPNDPDVKELSFQDAPRV
jgi:hypothetical protein